MVYKPRLDNKAADALSRISHTIELCNLTAPALVDIEVIKKEVEEDEKLSKMLI